MSISNMGFLTPLGLLGLLGIPLIIILYMLRPKNKPTIIPSTYLWETVLSELESASKIQKLRSSILMFLQILAVLLLGLLLAGFYYLVDVQAAHTIVIVDNTISMLAEDAKPNRLAVAKESAIAYVENLPEDQRITLIEMKDVPVIHVNDSTSKQIVTNILSDIDSSGLNGDYDLLTEVTKAVSSKAGGEIVYFGDKNIPGTTTYLVGGKAHNAGISSVTYSAFESDGISVLADVYSTNAQKIQLSLYGDDVLLDTISLEIGESLKGKAFFSVVPDIFSVMKVTIDDGDILPLDNESLLTLQQREKKRVALVTEGNIFLEKVLLLNENLEVYKVALDDRVGVLGFDLYIYDGIFPEEYPEEGTVVLFNYQDETLQMSQVSNPSYKYTEHPVANHLTENDFAIGLSKVYELPLWAEPIMTTDEGAIIYGGRLDKTDFVVFGFDIHNTDLPLTASFPIMMTNLVDYYINQSQVLGEDYKIGDTVEIKLSPDTLEAEIISPSETTYEIDVASGDSRFSDTRETGIYSLVTKKSSGTYTEAFVINGSVSGSDLKGFGSELSAGRTVTTHETMALWIGLLFLLVLLVEWIIYGVRRKRV